MFIFSIKDKIKKKLKLLTSLYIFKLFNIYIKKIIYKNNLLILNFLFSFIFFILFFSHFSSNFVETNIALRKMGKK